MIRKIVYSIFSLSILIGGYFAIGKLRYLERSSAIITMSSAGGFGGRSAGNEFEGGRRFENRGFAEPGRRQLPDSVRQRFEGRRDGHGFERNVMELPDSIRQKFASGRPPREGDMVNRGDFRGGFRGREGFGNGKEINLRNVVWFMLVFASFTVITLYLDKVYCYFRRKKHVKI